MKIDNYTLLYFDHDQLRETVKQILTDNQLKNSDIATSVGYTADSLNDYMYGRNNSRFIAGALCAKFHLDPKKFTKKGYRV